MCGGMMGFELLGSCIFKNFLKKDRKKEFLGSVVSVLYFCFYMYRLLLSLSSVPCEVSPVLKECSCSSAPGGSGEHLLLAFCFLQ